MVELGLVLLLLGATTFFITRHLRERRLRRECRERLWKIYNALEMYEIDRGSLPHLSFFPDDPKQDPASLPVVLQPYINEDSFAVCPSAPPALREQGLTYVWNVELNGRKLHAPGVSKWMLVEIQALSGSVPPPHEGYYHILYSDGQVERSKNPPPDLQRM